MASSLLLRALLVQLTDALERAELDDHVMMNVANGAVWIDSALDDAEGRHAARGATMVPRPDGLWEWAVRRDFVRLQARGETKRRISATLQGPKTRRRFEVALSTDAGATRAFSLHRRRRLRSWAARVLRVHAVMASWAPGTVRLRLPRNRKRTGATRRKRTGARRLRTWKKS